MCFKKNTKIEGNTNKYDTNIESEGGEPIDLEKIEVKVKKESNEGKPLLKKRKVICSQYCCRRVLASIVLLLFLGGIVCYYVFINIILNKQKNDCEDTIPTKLTLVNVLFCDGLTVNTEYMVNGRNMTCIIRYKDPVPCKFPDNKTYIYLSKDGYHCSDKEETEKYGDCSGGIILFNLLSGLFGTLIFILIMIAIWQSIVYRKLS